MLRVLLVDDESLARHRLRVLLDQCRSPAAMVAGEAGDAVQAMELLHRQRFDLVLLDVRLPGAYGLVLARTLREGRDSPPVVFVSAHTDYAAQAFDIDAVDYLTKPVRLERLQQALHKTAYRINQSARQPVQATLLIPQREKMLRLPVSEVIYFKAEMKYLTVRAAHHSYLIDGSLSDLQARYPGIFLRVHRNALVAVRAMRALERVAGRSPNEDQWQLHLAGVDEALTISRRQLATVRSALKTRC